MIGRLKYYGLIKSTKFHNRNILQDSVKVIQDNFLKKYEDNKIIYSKLKNNEKLQDSGEVCQEKYSVKVFQENRLYKYEGGEMMSAKVHKY